MFTQDEEEQRYGLWVAFGAVFLTVVFVLGMAISKTSMFKKKPTASVATAPAAATSTAAEDIVALGEPLSKFYFATGKTELPVDAGPGIVQVVKAIKEGSGKLVLLSGFHDATGDAAQNAEIAKQRAKAVKAALMAQGVEEARIVMRRPEQTTGTGDNAEARRVEVRVQ